MYCVNATSVDQTYLGVQFKYKIKEHTLIINYND